MINDHAQNHDYEHSSHRVSPVSKSSTDRQGFHANDKWKGAKSGIGTLLGPEG
jgi:hypothetical protein